MAAVISTDLCMLLPLLVMPVTVQDRHVAGWGLGGMAMSNQLYVEIHFRFNQTLKVLHPLVLPAIFVTCTGFIVTDSNCKKRNCSQLLTLARSTQEMDVSTSAAVTNG